MRFSSLASLCAVLGFATPALGYNSYSTQNEWHSATIDALGGVGSMSENIDDQFFYDPSWAASDKRRFVWQFVGVDVAVSRDLVNATQDFQDLMKGSEKSSGGVENAVDLMDGVRSLFGKNMSVGMSLSLTALKMGGFSLHPYAVVNVGIQAHVPSLPEAALVGDAYGGIGIGYSRAFNKEWAWGVNLRPGARAYAVGDVSVAAVGDMSSDTSKKSSSESKNEFGNYGAGFYLPVDLGLSYQARKTLRLNTVLRDAGTAPSLTTLKGEKPPTYPMRWSLGATWTPIQSRNHEVSLGTDLQDMLGLLEESGLWYRWQWAGQYRYTLPFRTQTSFGLNTGLQSGYPAIGVFLDLFVAKLEVAVSTREAGYYIGQDPEPRYSARLTSQLTF
jgi:hypothetical protein